MVANGAYNLMNNFSECIIIGGGKSVTEGLALGLKDRIKDKFVITCNYAYKHFDSTFLAFMDRDFYVSAADRQAIYKDKYPDIHSELAALPLIIGYKQNPEIGKSLLPNTIMIPNPYKEVQLNLTGIFALSVAVKLNVEKIFLLGFDWTRLTTEEKGNKLYNPSTCNYDTDIHYYGKEIKPRGSGYVNFYEGHNPENFFKFFSNKTKIYNVSLNSNIQTFEKISYEHMFRLLNDEKINQDELRKQIKLSFDF
jgi:hypothetical protein